MAATRSGAALQHITGTVNGGGHGRANGHGTFGTARHKAEDANTARPVKVRNFYRSSCRPCLASSHHRWTGELCGTMHPITRLPLPLSSQYFYFSMFVYFFQSQFHPLDPPDNPSSRVTFHN